MKDPNDKKEPSAMPEVSGEERVRRLRKLAGWALDEPNDQPGHQSGEGSAPPSEGNDPNDPLGEDASGTLIGRYRLLRLVGIGGFGEVYEAEQSDQLNRRVALKLIKPGMGSREVVARFEAERQVLCMMDHPNVARVLDAGTSVDGRPFFVMEFVDGDPIDRFCEHRQLSVMERLQLFEQVCQAVEHAHAKGVIHRDIKPSNILVGTRDAFPLAKVIDFGIAKTVSGHLTRIAGLTQQDVIGTPHYMSPEQAEGNADIDTRADIYALGAVLYELVTGSTPLASVLPQGASMADVQHAIRDRDPLAPSVQVARAAKPSASATPSPSSTRRLGRLARGELDWMVMKAIDKDRSRRYATASALAIDIKRFLSGEPILAAPPSGSYLVRKFIRRHKGAVAASVMVVASLLVAASTFFWQAHRDRRRVAELEAITSFQGQVLAQFDPAASGKQLDHDVLEMVTSGMVKEGLSTEAQERAIAEFSATWRHVNVTDAARNLVDQAILKPAIKALDAEFADQPLVDAKLREALADRYRQMSKYAEAEMLYRTVHDVRARSLGEMHPDTLKTVGQMAIILQLLGRISDSEHFARRSLEGKRLVLGEDHPETIQAGVSMAMVIASMGKLADAEVLLKDALGAVERTLGPEDASVLPTTLALAIVLQKQGKLADAEPYFRAGVRHHMRVYGPDHEHTLRQVVAFGVLLRDQGKLEEAEQHLTKALTTARAVHGTSHINTLLASAALANVRSAQGRYAEAEELLNEVVVRGTESNFGDQALVINAKNALGNVFVEQARYREAIELLTDIESRLRQIALGGHAPNLAMLLYSLGRSYAKTGDYASSEARLIEAYGIFELHPKRFSQEALECLRAIVSLYEAWHLAEPGRGFDVEASEWKAKLALRLNRPGNRGGSNS